MASTLLFADPGTTNPMSHRCLVWTTDLIGYAFYQDSSAQHVYRKTTDGGASWATAVVLFTYTSSGIGSLDVWYDHWTRDDTGTKIHICANGRTSGTLRSMRYRSLDTSDDSLGSIITVASTSGGSNPSLLSAVITKARGGNIYVAGQTNGTTHGFWRSTNGGTSFAARSSLMGAASDRLGGLYYAGEADNQDIFAVIFSNTDTKYTFNVYDNSADSWSSADIKNVSGGHPGFPNMAGSMRHSDDHLMLALWPSTSIVNASVIEFYDIVSTASITKRADIATSLSLVYTVNIVMDHEPDTLYACYIDNANADDTGDVFYRKSTDGGVSWDTLVEYKLSDDSEPRGMISCPSVSNGDTGRLFLIWFDFTSNDAYSEIPSAFDLPVLEPFIDTTYAFAVDWGGNGDFVSVNDVITSDVVGTFSYSRGSEEELELGVAAAGRLQFVVRNDTGKYSPENTSSVLFPDVIPGRKILVTATFESVTYDVFKGSIEKYIPNPGHGAQNCSILCVDGMDQLNRRELEAPERGIITNVKMGAATRVSGVDITFADANPDTIVRASGSFITDGFQAGMRVFVAASVSNNGSFVIATVAALTLTLNSNEVLTNEGPSSGITVDAHGPVGIILDEAGWPAGSSDRALDAGVDDLDIWWVHGEKASGALKKLAAIEGSFMYIDPAGKFTYEDRHHRLGDNGVGATDHLTSQADFLNNMQGMDYEYSSRSVRNVVRVLGTKMTAKTVAYVWETQDTPQVPANGTTVIWADLPQPSTGIVVPVANTDWKANTAADGSGSDITSSITITGVVYGQAVKMTLVSTSGFKAHIIPGTTDPEHTLRIQAQAFESNEVMIEVEDATSITAHDERVLEVKTQFKGSQNDLLAFAQYELARRKDPQPDFVRMTVKNAKAAIWTNILKLKLSDRITVTEDNLAISTQDYFINRMEHTVDMAAKLHTVVFSLGRVDEEQFWVLGVAGFSELGQTTVLIA